MKGYVGLAYMIAFAIFIIAIGFLVFHYFASFEQKTEGYEQSSKKLGEMYILNKIITSRNCLGTGETGVLNKTLVVDADGGGELDCAYLPDFGHYVRVDDLSNGAGWDWSFGYRRESRIGRYKFFEIPVSIVDGNQINPGKISVGVISSKEDLIVYLAGQAERAWTKEGLNVVFTPPEKDIGGNLVQFNSDEICESGDVCKKLFNAVLDSDIGSGTPGALRCRIKYTMIAGPKLDPMLECSNVI